MSDDVERQRVDPWHPMTKEIDLKHLGKLAEELGECQAAVARCIIQGIEEVEPDTKKPNRIWLEQEIADVVANFSLVTGHFKLDRPSIIARTYAKIKKLHVWHSMLEEKK